MIWLLGTILGYITKTMGVLIFFILYFNYRIGLIRCAIVLRKPYMTDYSLKQLMAPKV